MSDKTLRVLCGLSAVVNFMLSVLCLAAMVTVGFDILLSIGFITCLASVIICIYALLFQ